MQRWFGPWLMWLALLVPVLLLACGPAHAQTTGWGPPGGPFNFTTAALYCASKGAASGSVAAQVISQNPAGFGIDGWSGPNVNGNCQMLYHSNACGTNCGADAGWPVVSGSYTAPNPCTSGQGTFSEQNVTNGWTRTSTPDADDYVVGQTPIVPVELCDGQCVHDVQSVVRCMRSQVPASNGLHRVSCDWKVRQSATQCSAKTAGTDPAVAVPPCPGVTGQVNGKPACVGTASTPLPHPAAPASAAGIPQDVGNPAAGARPSSGVGSGDTGAGRTPTTGDGGNGGGGSNASIPGGGSEGNGQVAGTTNGIPNVNANVEVNVETCGLPGKPPCKIDETGTPTPADVTAAGTTATGQVDGTKESAVSAIDGYKTGIQKPQWTWTFVLPTGCSPIPIGAFEPYLTGIDICPWQPMIHDLMSLVWVAATIWACVSMVFHAQKD